MISDPVWLCIENGHNEKYKQMLLLNGMQIIHHHYIYVHARKNYFQCCHALRMSLDECDAKTQTMELGEAP